MKKLITIFFLFFTFTLNGQILDSTPKYSIINNDTFVIITKKQAQNIDYRLELYTLYKNNNIEFDSTLSTLLYTINDYKIASELTNIKINLYDSLILNQKYQISLLNKNLNIKNKEINISDSIITYKDNIINNNNTLIRKYKKTKDITEIIGFSLIVGILYLFFK